MLLKDVEVGNEYVVVLVVGYDTSYQCLVNLDDNDRPTVEGVFCVKAGNQKVFYFPTSPNYCFCATWRNEETQK